MLAFNEERPNRGGATTSDGKQMLICELATNSHSTRLGLAVSRHRSGQTIAPYRSASAIALEATFRRIDGIARATDTTRETSKCSATHVLRQAARGPLQNTLQQPRRRARFQRLLSLCWQHSAGALVSQTTCTADRCGKGRWMRAWQQGPCVARCCC